MTLTDAIIRLTLCGFEVVSQTPKFEHEEPWARYLWRIGRPIDTWEGPKPVYEYVLLVSDRDTEFMLEALVWRYLAPEQASVVGSRAPKAKPVFKKRGEQVDPYSDQQYKGFLPIYATILRGGDIIDL